MIVGVLQCHGRDISIKTNKTKRNILLILPMHYKFHGKSSYDVQIGSLTKTSTRNPEFVVQTAEHQLVFVGKYVAIKSKLFIIDCQMTKKQQNLLAEFYDKALVFTTENMNKTALSDAERSNSVDAEFMDLTVDPTDHKPTNAAASSSQNSSTIVESEYISQLGCSREAEMSCSKGGMARSVSGRTGSIQGSMSQLDTSVEMSQSQSPVMKRTTSRSGRSSAKKTVSYVENSDVEEDMEEEFEHSYKDSFGYDENEPVVEVESKTTSAQKKRKASETTATTPTVKASKTTKSSASKTPLSLTKKTPTSTARSAKKRVKKAVEDDEDVPTDVGSDDDDDDDDDDWDRDDRKGTGRKKSITCSTSTINSSAVVSASKRPCRNKSTVSQIIELSTSDEDDDDFEFE